MRCYIKDRLTFVTKSNHAVVDYDIFLGSIFDDRSNLTITGKQTAIEGDIVYLDNGWMGVISAIEIEHNETKLTCIEITHLFDRPISSNEYTIPAIGGGVEQAAIAAINACFIGVSDTKYKMPYIQSAASTYTYAASMILPDYDSNGIYTIYAYLKKILQAQNIRAAYALGAISGVSTMVMSLANQASPTLVIDFSDPAYTVTSERYENGALSKITVCGDAPPDAVWYLKTDGTVTTVKPADADRAPGAWTALFVGSSDDAQAAVTAEFAKNKYSHLIEFSTKKEFHLYDGLLIRKAGRLFSSYITSKQITAGSNKYFYKCGELKDFDAKLRGVINNGN